MLTYSFTDIGSDSLYEHLYKCIKKDILNRILTVNEKLPSKRTLAKNLNISTITVENAYAQLMAEGYIYSIPKKGYFVSDVSAFIRYSKTDNSSTTQSFDDYSKPDENYFADFISNSINPDNFPFSIWTKIIREVISEETNELMKNPPSGGIPKLRNAIAKYLLEFRGIDVDPRQIIIGAGTEYIYSLLIQLFNEDAVYGVEDPGYKKISLIYKSHGSKCRHIPMDNNGISMDFLNESDIDILHISPSHHYPTGIVTPISRRYELLNWASQSDKRYIIEDDYDCEFRLQGNPIPSLKSIDVLEKVIYINTFSKSLASTIRISYMVLPKHLLDLFYKKLGFYSCTVSNFEQLTLARFIEKGFFEKHINRQRNFYKSQRNVLLECIKKNFTDLNYTIKEEDAGLHFLLKIDTEYSDEELVKRAKENGLRIACLSQYYSDNPNDTLHTIVVNYSGLDTKKIPEAINRLYKSLL